MDDDEQSPKTYKAVKYIRTSYADREAEDRDMIDCIEFKKLQATRVTEWLAEKGFLKEMVSQDGKSSKRKTLTDRSPLIGITQEERVSQYGRQYIATLYSKEAQQFIIDNLDEIIAKSSNAVGFSDVKI